MRFCALSQNGHQRPGRSFRHGRIGVDNLLFVEQLRGPTRQQGRDREKQREEKIGKTNLTWAVLRLRRPRQDWFPWPVFPQQVPPCSGKGQQSEFHVRRTIGMSAKVVPRCNESRKKIRQQHSPPQPGLELRAPPEQAQRASQHAVKCGASEHDDLIVELTEALGGVGSLQQNGGFLVTKNLFGPIFLIANPSAPIPLSRS